jgi:restriction system protein
MTAHMEDKREPRLNETNGTHRTNRTYEPPLIPPHGGYRNLKSYQAAEIIYDATAAFCDRFIDRRSRTTDQMVQAARSGKQNIAEASQASGTSKKTELKLTSVARSSLEELLQDYQDFLRQRRLPVWDKDGPQARPIRSLAYRPDRTYETYRTYVEQSSAEVAANAVLCVVNQANFLLDRQLASLGKQFLDEGGFSERLYHARQEHRRNALPPDRTNRTDGTHRTNEGHGR